MVYAGHDVFYVLFLGSGLEGERGGTEIVPVGEAHKLGKRVERVAVGEIVAAGGDVAPIPFQSADADVYA